MSHVTRLLVAVAVLAALTGCEAEPQRARFDEAARQQWEQQVQAARVHVDRHSEVQSLEQALADKDLEISRLQSELNSLREELASLKARDENSLGSIHEIDAEGRIWIDIGSADDVTERQVFDVWSDGEAGAQARKGQIQVTRVMGAHLAQAKPVAEKTADKSGKALSGSAPPLAVGDKLRPHRAAKPTGVQFAPSKTAVQVGQVLKYEADLEMVTISLGADHGIVKGQKLYLYRTSPSKLLCEVRVLVVAADRCSAQHVDGLNATPVSLVAGDQAATSMPLGLERPAASDVLDKAPARKSPAVLRPR